MVKLALDNLMTFPWIAARVRAGGLRLHGVRFDIRNGVLEVVDANGDFTPATDSIISAMPVMTP